MKRMVAQLEPLTPIHIGDGQTMTPETYRIRDGLLTCFHVHRVIRDLPPSQHRKLEELLRQGQIDAFNQAQVLLQENCRPEHEAYQVRLGVESARELGKALKDPNRQAQVRMLARNPANGRVILPGSSIKGAIRTALINHFLHTPPAMLEQTRSDLRSVAAPKDRSRRLEENTLGFSYSEMAWDPLRLLKVSDGLLPEDQGALTQIDQVVNWNPNKEGSSQIQMHFERLLSRADHPFSYPTIPVTLSLDEAALQNETIRSHLGGHALSWELLREACNHFYMSRLTDEVKRFFTEPFVWQNFFRRGSTGELQSLRLDNNQRILLRIGRFCHYESLSVNDLRQGVDRDGNPLKEGQTRNLCVAGNTQRFPFGWALLTPVA